MIKIICFIERFVFNYLNTSKFRKFGWIFKEIRKFHRMYSEIMERLSSTWFVIFFIKSSTSGEHSLMSPTKLKILPVNLHYVMVM